MTDLALPSHTRRIAAILVQPWFGYLLLFLVLLVLIPPNGVLSDNEENYFQLASRAVNGTPGGPNSAVFDTVYHRYISELILGNMIALIGFEGTQIATRLLTAAAFTFLLPLLLGTFALSALDAALVVMIFELFDQSLIGGEWIFNGFESKVVAYALIMMALYFLRTRREASANRGLAIATVLSAVATYLHFLVGNFWFFALMGLFLIESRQSLRRVAAATLGFLVLTAPQTGNILWTRLAAAGDVLADTPNPDVIFSLIREPWHGAPFAGLYTFVVDWLPGYLLAGAMLAGCLVIVSTSTKASERNFARWVVYLFVYLFVVLIVAFVERRTGVIGKFYPFRPSSLTLLLWLTLTLAWCSTLVVRHVQAVKLLAIALIAPVFLSSAFSRILHDYNLRTNFAADKEAIAAYLSSTAPADAIVLIDPSIENSFLDFERRVHRPSLISWKFAPTNDAELREWYRRVEFRKALFNDGCPAKPAYHTDFMLTMPDRADMLSRSCGPVVLATPHWRLLRLPTAAR